MYEIGQVVFVVLSKKQQIFPMQVVETVTKKTLQGEEIKYCLQAGSDKSTKIMLDQLDGEIFTSAEEAKSTLVARATEQIYALVSSAEKKAYEWYKSNESSVKLQTVEPKISFNIEQDQPEENTIVLPDGQIARIKLPVITV